MFFIFFLFLMFSFDQNECRKAKNLVTCAKDFDYMQELSRCVHFKKTAFKGLENAQNYCRKLLVPFLNFFPGKFLLDNFL